MPEEKDKNLDPNKAPEEFQEGGGPSIDTIRGADEKIKDDTSKTRGGFKGNLASSAKKGALQGAAKGGVRGAAEGAKDAAIDTTAKVGSKAAGGAAFTALAASGVGTWAAGIGKWTTEQATKIAIKLGLKDGNWKKALAAMMTPAITIILLFGISGIAIARIVKANRGADGNSVPEYIEASNPDDIALLRELLGKTPGGMIFPAVHKTASDISSPWGKQREGYVHRGIDAYVPIGIPYYAATDGEVIYLEDTIADHDENVDNYNSVGDSENGGFGNTIVVRVTSGTWTEHLWEIHHLKQNSSTELGLKKGSLIRKGSFIGRSGHNGRSSGPHIHFQVNKPDGKCEATNRSGRPCGITDDTIDPVIALGW